MSGLVKQSKIEGSSISTEGTGYFIQQNMHKTIKLVSVEVSITM